MSIFKYIFLSIIIIFIPADSSGQDIIRGFVRDQQTDDALIGVNILIDGTARGTQTDADGYFELPADSSPVRITLSYVGYVKTSLKADADGTLLNIAMEPDNVALNEVQVIGFDNNKKLLETAASIALITGADFKRTNKTSLQPVLNNIPGVQMDQSNLGDARISIRGAGSRSNWGIRNIKIYLNDIPLTEPDGFTRIEGLDVAAVGRAEIIKGPASSIYGAGTGGVINFQLEKAPYGENSIELSALGGSYGLGRLTTTYRSGGDSFNANISYGRQTSDGYREHSSDNRTFFTGSLQFYPSQKQTLTLLLNRSHQDSFIPGNLTARQVSQNPQQASLDNLDKKAGRFQTWTRFGASHTYKFSKYFENRTSVYTSFYNLDHPLAYAYIRQPLQSYGGRTLLNFNPDFGILPTVFTLGGEFLNGISNARQFVNNAGKVGELTVNQELNNTQFSVFYNSETALTKHTSVVLGLSANQVTYNITDFMADSLSGTKSFNLEFAPRAGITHVFNEKAAVRASISSGFSPPTTSEIEDAQGRINRNVQAERGLNYEAGVRGNLFGGRLNYDVSLFSFQMKNQLIPQTVGQGNVIYVNAGKSSQNGLEAALSYFWSARNSNVINYIRPYLSYSYSDFTFREFKIQDTGNGTQEDFSGNKITGIAPHVLSAGFDIETRPGIYLGSSFYFRDKTPITDNNEVFNKAYSVVNANLGYRKTFRNLIKIDFSAGINNLTDTRYSSFVALNAVSYTSAPPAFYNPAPARNFYTQLSISYLF